MLSTSGHHDVARHAEIDRAIDSLCETAPTFVEAVRKARDDEHARSRVRQWLDGRHRALHDEVALPALEASLALSAHRVLSSLIGRRNERRAGFSTLATLRSLLRGEPGSRAKTSTAFVLEWLHLLRAICGVSGLARGWLDARLHAEGFHQLDFAALRGRQAAKSRSDYLDALGQHARRGIARHASGLDGNVIKAREKARSRILQALGGELTQWHDHRWQLGHIFKGPGVVQRLAKLITLSSEDRRAIALAVDNDVPFGITPYYLSLFDLPAADDTRNTQVRAQVIPPLSYVQDMIAARDRRGELLDFMGETDTSPIELVTRRYPFVAIFKPLDTCPQICVYCQRNWEIEGPMSPAGYPELDAVEKALRWFGEHEVILDTLVTGGDPIFLSDRRIEKIMMRLAEMDHVCHIRWGSRAPVTMPMRITPALTQMLGRFVEPGRRSVSLVTHIESAAEVTPEMGAAVDRLRKAGISVYNQQVYTVHTSRRFQSVAARIAMKRVGVDPYYTFYPKGKEETRDYLTPVARVLQERREEVRLLPGIFRTDEPVFNVPRLGKNHMRASQDRELVAIQSDGRRLYLWHPWEKGITDAEPALCLDTSIEDYLQRMEELGEDREDYESIWYYW